MHTESANWRFALSPLRICGSSATHGTKHRKPTQNRYWGRAAAIIIQKRDTEALELSRARKSRESGAIRARTQPKIAFGPLQASAHRRARLRGLGERAQGCDSGQRPRANLDDHDGRSQSKDPGAATDRIRRLDDGTLTGAVIGQLSQRAEDCRPATHLSIAERTNQSIGFRPLRMRYTAPMAEEDGTGLQFYQGLSARTAEESTPPRIANTRRAATGAGGDDEDPKSMKSREVHTIRARTEA
ncbi:hypothetical protein D9611_009793 [Ephemerocybe angulata]|uniref:Uncharacterized protein n=1 Tax=Ephemerocybe angulata TaxID=980116 RepID=A0A8H5CD66_9AGAR|nr:hypothetical protein D9611_009793 [Tulosesus angulatus]